MSFDVTLRNPGGGFNVTLSVPAGTGLVKVWNGSAWVEKPAKVWNGSAWVTKPVKFWTGSAWEAA